MSNAVHAMQHMGSCHCQSYLHACMHVWMYVFQVSMLHQEFDVEDLHRAYQQAACHALHMPCMHAIQCIASSL